MYQTWPLGITYPLKAKWMLLFTPALAITHPMPSRMSFSAPPLSSVVCCFCFHTLGNMHYVYFQFNHEDGIQSILIQNGLIEPFSFPQEVQVLCERSLQAFPHELLQSECNQGCISELWLLARTQLSLPPRTLLQVASLVHNNIFVLVTNISNEGESTLHSCNCKTLHKLFPPTTACF
jgi:hypothetical protein